MRLSARDILRGTIIEVQRGATTAHVRIELPTSWCRATSHLAPIAGLGSGIFACRSGPPPFDPSVEPNPRERSP